MAISKFEENIRRFELELKNRESRYGHPASKYCFGAASDADVELLVKIIRLQSQALGVYSRTEGMMHIAYETEQKIENLCLSM